MKLVAFSAMVMGVLGAGAWDAALPFTLLAIALPLLVLVSLASKWSVRRQRVTRLRQRLLRPLTAEIPSLLDEPGFAAMKTTLVRLVEATAELRPDVEDDLPSAEIFILDHYRGGDSRSVPQSPAVMPEAVVMQHRLMERVAGLRARDQLLPRHVARRAVKDAK